MGAVSKRRLLRSGIRSLAATALSVFLTLLAACAGSGRDIRVDQDRSADFGSFRTYAYVSELGTDRAGYSTLVTSYFREAVDRQMQQRGYRYSESNPDLLVNFFADAREVTTIQQHPRVWLGYGYYGYRFGMYNVWPLYADGPQTVRYKVGTANIDIVDARERQLIWEGVAEGRLTREIMDDPRSAIHDAVAELFSRFPGRAMVTPAE